MSLKSVGSLRPAPALPYLAEPASISLGRRLAPGGVFRMVAEVFRALHERAQLPLLAVAGT